MIKFSLVFIFFFTVEFSFSNEKDRNDLSKLAHNYLHAVLSADLESYKGLVTPKFFKEQTKSRFIKKAFRGKKNFSINDIKIDIKVKKAAKTKNKYFLNLKEKTKKEYDDDWFIVLKDIKSDQWKIDGLSHQEED